MNVFLVILALVLAACLAFSPRLGRSSRWKATVTPLASIMGSGFLVSAPLLADTVGNAAVLAMAVLLALAYAIGGAIRFNIRHFEPLEHSEQGLAQAVAFLSRVVLGGAYFVSVTYYLKLLAAFATSAAGVRSELSTNLTTSLLLVAICGIGMWRGLGMLEGVETYTVALNLGTIVALLCGLAVYNVELLAAGDWALADVSPPIDFHSLRVVLGLLIVVQGFETSRYLGTEHSADERIATMKTAQRLSAVIYLVFIGLVTVLFNAGHGADVTAITAMALPVAAVLPAMIYIAALGSQFSAAVADSEGAGGLIEETTHRRVPIRQAYLLLLLVTLALAWETDVNGIIAYASRAFALFYALQCVVAFLVAWEQKSLARRPLRLATFAALAGVCLLIFALGLPSE